MVKAESVIMPESLSGVFRIQKTSKVTEKSMKNAGSSKVY